jgi:hypothetical protein
MLVLDVLLVLNLLVLCACLVYGQRDRRRAATVRFGQAPSDDAGRGYGAVILPFRRLGMSDGLRKSMSAHPSVGDRGSDERFPTAR